MYVCVCIHLTDVDMRRIDFMNQTSCDAGGTPTTCEQPCPACMLLKSASLHRIMGLTQPRQLVLAAGWAMRYSGSQK